MIQDIEIKGKKCLAVVLDDGVDREEMEFYRRGLLDLACYAAAMAEENPNIDAPLLGISYAIKVARMME